MLQLSHRHRVCHPLAPISPCRSHRGGPCAAGKVAPGQRPEPPPTLASRGHWHVQEGTLEPQGPVTPNRRVWLPSHPSKPRDPTSPCIRSAQWAWQPSTITQHRNCAKGPGQGAPPSHAHHPLLPSRQFPFAGPGHRRCSVPEPRPASLACYSWKRGKEICLF